MHHHTIQVVVRLLACKFILAKQSYVLSLVGVGDTCAMRSCRGQAENNFLGAELRCRVWQPAPLPLNYLAGLFLFLCRRLSGSCCTQYSGAILKVFCLFSSSGKHSQAKLPRPALSLTSFPSRVTGTTGTCRAYKDSFPEAGPSQLGSLGFVMCAGV